LLRVELKLPASEAVTIGLRSREGDKHATQRLRLTNQGYRVAQVRSRPSRLLDGNIGYLLIPAMDDRLVELTVATIKSFRDTKGLIIDVRNNQGGTYGLMRGIYGFFVPDDAGPHVTNIAAYRLSANFARDHIEYRPTYRADWEGWSDQERAAIRQASAAFKPEWQLAQGKFSDWHYMILSRERSGRGNRSQTIVAGGPGKDYFFYDKPVVILSNAVSISATDGFLNAFADLPQVTIVGEPSAGGSGATRQFQLSKTRLVIALSSMASFRPNGKLFDGNGIEVDVAVKPEVEDYTTDGDSVLARGIDLINEKSK
jgi:C-terminal processing protease CtpA/Prc